MARDGAFPKGVPNTALPVNIDGDGDADVIAAKRVRQEVVVIENQGVSDQGELLTQPWPVRIISAVDVPAGWRALTNAFQTDTSDINNDGRLGLLLNVL